MLKYCELAPGVGLWHFPDDRFKQGCISLQIVRPMGREEAAKNALLPAVLLRGTEKYPDLRKIAMHLDDLYGADVGAMVRRVGDYQTTGFACSFIEDRFTIGGEGVLRPVTEFLGELLRHPLTEGGAFLPEIVAGEKQNLIDAIEAQKNDKRLYAANQLLRILCREDAFGIPRLGDREQAEAITAQSLYDHYEKILRESRIDCFYVGSAGQEQVAALLMPLFSGISRDYRALPPHTPLISEPVEDTYELMDVAQGKLCMGFTTPIALEQPQSVAMRVCNVILGGGMSSKLFSEVREKQSLCYDIGSAYYGMKGIVTVSAGIDRDKEQQVRRAVCRQVEAMAKGEITDAELDFGKKALLNSVRGIHDAPGSIENYYATGALSGVIRMPEDYRREILSVTAEQVAEAAKTLRLQTVYFLMGVEKC